MISYKEYLRVYEPTTKVAELKITDQAFRRYSEAVMTWLHDLNIVVLRDDKSIQAEIIYAFPSKAHALKGASNYRPHGQYQKDLETKLVSMREDRAPVPIISYYLADLSLAMERQLPGDIRYFGGRTSESNLSAYRLQKERPYDLTYVFSLWTRYKADMNYIWQSFLHEFDPVKYFVLDQQQIPFRLENITDNSDLESVDGAEQLVRWDMTCTMEGWLKTNPVSVPTVQKQFVALSEEIAGTGAINDLMKIRKEFDLRTGEVDYESVE